VIESWRRNWERLTTYFRYDKSIRKLIYTTNTIEGFHRQVRKVTKTKGAFTSDMALLTLIYLAQRNIKTKWTMPLAKWGVTAQRLAIWFPGRMVLDLAWKFFYLYVLPAPGPGERKDRPDTVSLTLPHHHYDKNRGAFILRLYFFNFHFYKKSRCTN